MADYDTQFPAWMAQSTRDNANIGSMLGQNILQGLRFQEEKARFAELEPLRNAQIATAQAQARILQNDANLSALAAEDEASARGSMADAMALSQDIAGSPNGYTNPESEARFYSFLGERPWLGNTQWAKQQEERFNAATQYRRRAEELTRVQQNAIALEKERTAGDLAVAKARGEIGTPRMREVRARVDGMVQRGEITPEQASLTEERLMKEATSTAAQKNTSATVNAMIKAGLADESDRAQLVFQAQTNGGRIPDVSETTILKLADRGATIELTDKVVDEVDAFKQKYGPNALDSYLGQFDVPFDRALDIIRKRNTPRDQDALRIFQTFADVRNGKIKTISGATVTVPEQTRLDQSIGTTLNKNFEQQLRTFNQNERTTFRSVLGSLEDRRIPQSLKRIADGPVRSEQSTNAPSGIPTVGSKAQYDALPTGAKFIDSTGKVKTKR